MKPASVIAAITVFTLTALLALFHAAPEQPAESPSGAVDTSVHASPPGTVRPRHDDSAVMPAAIPENPGATDPPIRLAEGLLSIRIAQWPLHRLCEALGRHLGITITAAADIAEQRVSEHFSGLPMEEGLRRLFAPWDSFFAYRSEGAAGRLSAIWIYAAGKGESLLPVPPETWASTRELEEELAAAEPQRRAQALDALVQRRGEVAEALILRALEDPDAEVRVGALDTALNYGIPLPLERLLSLAQGVDSDEVRARALESIGYRQWPDADQAALARAALESATAAPSPALRERARLLLREWETTQHPPAGKAAP